MTGQDNTEEFFWKTYEKLTDDLKEALFSEENFTIVSEICDNNGLVEDEQKEQIMKYVGKVIMGLLSIREFPIILELELDLESEKARDISWDIDRKIFSHLRISLNKLFTSNVAENKDLGDNTKQEGDEKPKEEGAKPSTEEKPLPAQSGDGYREPLI